MEKHFNVVIKMYIHYNKFKTIVNTHLLNLVVLNI